MIPWFLKQGQPNQESGPRFNNTLSVEYSSRIPPLQNSTSREVASTFALSVIPTPYQHVQQIMSKHIKEALQHVNLQKFTHCFITVPAYDTTLGVNVHHFACSRVSHKSP